MTSNWFIGIPELKISENEKYADDQKWFRKVMDYHVPIGLIGSMYKKSFLDKWNNYKLLNNDFIYEDWKPVCDELGFNEEMFKNKWFTFNIMPKIVNYLLSVELRRTDNYTPVLLTQNAMSYKDSKLKEEVNTYMNKVIEMTMITSQKYKELEAQGLPPQELEKQIAQFEQELQAQIPVPQIENFVVEQEILANKIIEHAKLKHRIKKVKNEAMRDVIVVDEEVVMVDVDVEPKIERINPMYIMYHKSPDIEYIQDGDWVCYTVPMTPYELKLRFPELTEEDYQNIGLKQYNVQQFTDKITTMHHDMYPEWDMQWLGTNQQFLYDENASYGIGELPQMHRERLIPVTHIQWKAFKQVGVLEVLNEYGEITTEFVDDSFQVPTYALSEKFLDQYGIESTKYSFDGMTLVWYYFPRVYEGVRIGLSLYRRMREKPFQHLDSDNPFECKLSYYGRSYSNYNSRSISLLERMKPYNVLYSVIMNKLIELVARYDGALIPIDTSMVDKELGRLTDGSYSAEKALERTLQWRKAGYYLYNSAKDSEGDDAKLSRPTPAIMEANTTSEMSNLINILDWVSREIGMIVGISPQALAQMFSDTASQDQQALVQTSYMIDPYFNAHNWTWQEIIEGYLNTFVEWAKWWFDNNPNRSEHFLQYLFGENTKGLIRITKEQLDFAEYGVMINNSASLKEYYDYMLQLSHAMIQNDVMTAVDVSSLLLGIMQGESPYETHKRFKEAQAKREQREDQAQQMQQQVEEKKMEMSKHIEELQSALINLKEQWQSQHIQEKGAVDKEIKAMDVYKNQMTLDANGDNIPDPIAAAELQHKINIETQKLGVEKENAITNRRSQSFEEIKHQDELSQREEDRKVAREKIRADLQKASKSRNTQKK